MSETEEMFLKATELGYTEVPDLQTIWDHTVEVGKEKFPMFDDYSVFRRLISTMMGFYCEKALFRHDVKGLLILFIMRAKYGKHWLEKEWK